jgi:hypothetical protein
MGLHVVGSTYVSVAVSSAGVAAMAAVCSAGDTCVA